VDLAAVEVVRERRCGPDGGGRGAEKKTLVGGGSDRAFAVHRCGGDGLYTYTPIFFI
jgi:hypothetical protein